MEITGIIILMGVVTYLPRLLPLYLIDVERIPGRLKLVHPLCRVRSADTAGEHQRC
jgi:branched-subunit amino acid transport protein